MNSWTLTRYRKTRSAPAMAGGITRACTGDQPRTETVHIDAPAPQSMHAVITRKVADSNYHLLTCQNLNVSGEMGIRLYAR